MEIIENNRIYVNKSITYDEIDNLRDRKVDCSHEIDTEQNNSSCNNFTHAGFELEAKNPSSREILSEIKNYFDEISEMSDEQNSDLEFENINAKNQTDKLQYVLDVKSKQNSFFITKTKVNYDRVKNCYPLHKSNIPQDNPSPNQHFSCIKNSKEYLYIREDHLAIFIPADRKFTTETNKQLLTENRMKIDDLLNKDIDNIEVGNVIVFKYEKYFVFNIIVKPIFASKPTYNDVVNTLKALKVAMDQLEINTVSVSRVGNGLNQLSWPNVESEIKKIFGQDIYYITVCYGEVEIPNEDDILGIISENHALTPGGHKGARQTLERIREHFCWPNMREYIRNFVRNCETCKVNKFVKVKTRQPM